MLKRILKIAVISALTIVGFAACGSSDNQTTGKVTVSGGNT